MKEETKTEQEEEPQLKPMYYSKGGHWEKEQSVIIERILRDDYKNYEENKDLRRTMVTSEIQGIIKEWIKECGRLDNKD